MVQQLDSFSKTETFMSFVDPYLLNAARHIYQKCYEIHPEKAEQTQGIAINRETYRGQLIFNDKPILLPWESFISSEELITDSNQ